MAETLRKYAHRVESALVNLMKQEGDWKAVAEDLERAAWEGGLLPAEAFPLPKGSLWEWVGHLISEQDIVLDNSNLVNLYERKWDPKNALNPGDLLSHLLI